MQFVVKIVERKRNKLEIEDVYDDDDVDGEG